MATWSTGFDIVAAAALNGSTRGLRGWVGDTYGCIQCALAPA